MQEDARRITETYLAHHPDLGCTGVREVYRWTEIPWAPPSLYWPGPGPPSPDQLERAWVCFLARPNDGEVLRSSVIIVVSHETGEVLYAGSAHDEG